MTFNPQITIYSQKKVIQENILNEIDEFESFIFEYINENLNTLTENGTLER